MKKSLCMLAVFSATTLSISAQEGNTLASLLVKHWQTAKTFTLAVADKMPDDQYSYKASPPEMSFGEMVNHIGDANFVYCSRAFGSKGPAKGTDASKSPAVKHLTDSFDFCLEGLQKISDADLMKKVGQGTPFESQWGAFTHTAHHRAQLEVYLRLKGIDPPEYKF
jgi:uncharacterized damage-inducible protein DinB